MPYELVQSRGKKEGYYVVTKKTREKHSKRPLSLEKAKAQMRALYAAESKSMRGGNVFRRMFGLPLGEYTQQLKDDIDRMIGRDKTERFLLGIRPYTNQEARGIASYYTRGAAQLSDVGTTHLLHGIETGNPLAHSIIREYERRQRKLEIIAQTKSLLADYLKMIRPLESRGIPMGATDAIMISVEIKDGDTMVDFENEYRLGRYYLQSTYDSLPTPKVNPFNRRPIVNPKTYKAKVSPESVYIENPLQRGSRPTVGSGMRGGLVPSKSYPEQEQLEENLEQEQMIGRGRMYGGRINNEPPGGLPPPEEEEEEEEEVNDDFQNMINGFINQVNELGNGLETINDMNLAQLRAYAQRVGVILAENHESTKAQIPDQFDDDEKEAILAQNEAYAANPEQMTMARKPNLTLIVMALIDAIVLKIDALQAPVGQMIGQGMCGGSVYDKTFGYLPDYFFEY